MSARQTAPETATGGGDAGEALPLWRTARSQRVRELAWCTLSPRLLARLPGGPDGTSSHPIPPPRMNGHASLAWLPPAWTLAWQRWLADADPAQLPPTIDELAADPHPSPGMPPRSLRLGRHAERLLEFALGRMENVSLVAVNLPVRRGIAHGVQTLGELDFVWRDLAANEVVHWEMAAKFYLLQAPVDSSGMDGEAWRRCFVGPNLVDRLGDKLAHIVDRQLPLARTPEAQSLLGMPIDRSEAYLLGWLFYRDGIVPPGVDAATGLAPDHLRGWWSTLQGLRRRHADASAQGVSGTVASDIPAGPVGPVPSGGPVRWCRLSRSHWLAPALVRHEDTETFETLFAALAERFSDPEPLHGWRRDTPVMVCELEPAGWQAGDNASAPLWRERSRGFVVPPGWEARATARTLA